MGYEGNGQMSRSQVIVSFRKGGK